MTLRQVLIYFWYSLLVFIPFSIEIGDSHRFEFPLEPALLLFDLGLLIYALRQKKISFFFTLKHFSVFGIGFAASLSIINAVFPMIAAKACVIWWVYVFGFYGSWIVLDFTSAERQTMLKVIASASILLLTYATIHLIQLGIHYQNSYLMALPWARGHTLLLAISFPLWLYLSDLVFSEKANKLQIFLWILCNILIVISYSRLYWVLVCFYIFIFLLQYGIKWRRLILGIALLVIITSTIVFKMMQAKRNHEKAWLNPDDHNSWFVQVESIFDLSKNESNIERTYRWKIGALMLKDHIWTGVGLNNYAEVYPLVSAQLDFQKTTHSNTKMNAHQWYLGTLYEQGIIGLTALLLFLTTIMWRWRQWNFLITTIIIHYLALGFIEDFALSPEIIPGFWIALGWLNSTRPKPSNIAHAKFVDDVSHAQ